MSISPAIRMFSQFFICQNGYSFTIFRCVRGGVQIKERGPLKQKIRDEVCPNSSDQSSQRNPIFRKNNFV